LFNNFLEEYMGGLRFDLENQLSVAQAFTGAATVSTHSYKKQTAAQDISIGRRMALLVMPTVAAGSGSTHTLEVIQADNAALSSGVEVLSSVSVAAADLQVGDQIEIPIPQGVMDKMYLGFRNTATGGTTTVTLDVYLVPQDEIAKYKSFPKVNDAEV
jgi:predicted RecA/RadA family phage recombinase